MLTTATQKALDIDVYRKIVNDVTREARQVTVTETSIVWWWCRWRIWRVGLNIATDHFFRDVMVWSSVELFGGEDALRHRVDKTSELRCVFLCS